MPEIFDWSFMKIIDCFTFTNLVPKISKQDFNHATHLCLGHFTSSAFLNEISNNGLLPPSHTGKISNEDMFCAGDENYIYFTARYDKVFAENATNKYGGRQMLFLVYIEKNALELDDLNGFYTNKGIINLKDQDILYDTLQNKYNNNFNQCRTKVKILPSKIIEHFYLDGLHKYIKLSPEERSTTTLQYKDIKNIML